MQYKKPEKFKAIETFINEYADENGTTPTVRDIAAGTDLSRALVARYLRTMAESGIITYDEHRRPITRRIQNEVSGTTRSPLRRCGAPIIGTVACGELTDSEENVEETVRLPKAIFGDGPLFVLHASGASMIEAGIDDGDLVVIRQQETANAGQIVVALVDGATTLKRFYPEPEKHRIRLHPENRTMEDIYVESCVIQGVAVKVIKDVM